MLNRLRVIVLPLLLLSGAVLAGKVSAQQISIDEAVRQGLEENARVRASQFDVAEAEAARRAARAALLPSVEARASYTRLSDNIPAAEFALPGFDTTFTLLPVELNRYHTELSVEQALFAGGRIVNQARAARRQAEAATMRAHQEEADVAFEVRQAYWLLHQSQAVVEALDAALVQMDAHVREVDAQVREGLALRADLLTAQARRSEIELDRIDAVNASDLARMELNRLIGRPLRAEVEVAPAVDPPMVAPGGVDVYEVPDEHPTIESLELQVEALESLYRATRGAWLPEIAAIGRYVYARPNQYFFLEQDAFRSSWEAGVAMRWSLFGGGRRGAESARARARLASAEARLDDVRGQMEASLVQRGLEVNRARQAVSVAEQAVEAAAEALRVTGVSYREGMVLSSALLDAEQTHYNARARLARAQADRGIAAAALLNALGRVW